MKLHIDNDRLKETIAQDPYGVEIGAGHARYMVSWFNADLDRREPVLFTDDLAEALKKADSLGTGWPTVTDTKVHGTGRIE